MTDREWLTIADGVAAERERQQLLSAAEREVEWLREDRNEVLAEMGATPENMFQLDDDLVDRIKVEKAVILTNALARAIERRDALLP